MGRTTGGGLTGTRPTAQRLRSEDRRAALLDAGAALLARDGIDAVSMDAVAVRAGVSRPLVYKHFANRDELLAAVLHREAVLLDATIVAAVGKATGLEDKVRALIRAVLDAVRDRDAIFTPLLRAGVRVTGFRAEQRARDRRTVRFFARLAASELGVDEGEARAAMAVLLTGIDSVRVQWHARPTPEHRRFLEDLYVDLVVGGLSRVAARTRPPE